MNNKFLNRKESETRGDTKLQKKILLYFNCLEFYAFILFSLTLLITSLIDNLSLRSFAVIVFFFIPGYLLLKSVTNNKYYNPIESIIISFGLSLFLIIIITFILIKFSLWHSIIFVYFIVTTILFVIVILRKIRTNFSKFSPTISFRSALRNLLSLLRKDKHLLIIVFMTIFFFFLGFFLRQYSIIRFPDEYYYLWVSDNDILPIVSYRDFSFMDLHFIISSMEKLGFILITAFHFNIIGTTTGIAPHILSLLFYSMLIPATYLIGSLHKKKTGFLAALFIACNPIIWFWNNRIMPDILFTVIVAACLYFFYKSLNKRESINWKYFIPAIIFGLLSYTQQPKLIFTLGIPFIIYFLSTAKRGIKNNRILFILIFTVVFLFFFLLLTTVFFASWFFQYDFPTLLDGLFSIFYFNFQDWIEFLSPGGTIWFCFSYPYYYSYAIIILAIIGSFCFAFRHTKRESVLFFLSIVITFYIHSTCYSEYGARFSFLIFPIIMVLAAIGFTTDIGNYSVFLVPLLFFLFPFLLINEPGIPQFPQILYLLRIISILIAITIIGYKVLNGVKPIILKNLNKFMGVMEWKRFQISANLKSNKPVSVIMIFLVTSSSLGIGISIVTNDQYFRNDYITPEDVGLPQAGKWLTTNVPTNSVIVTNVRAHILSYYTDFSFNFESEDLRINRQEIGIIITPSSETEFLYLIDEKEFDYLIVFTNPVIGEHWKRPYLYPYVVEGSLFTIYELVDNFNISESTDGWYDTAGDIIFSLDSTDKKDGLYSIKLEGMTNEYNQTRININGIWNLYEKDYLNFWFKLDNATNQYYFSIVLTDNVGNYRYWNNDMQVLNDWDSNIWQYIQITLHDYKGQKGTFNIEQVNRISIYVYAASNTSIAYHIDQFQASSPIILKISSF